MSIDAKNKFKACLSNIINSDEIVFFNDISNKKELEKLLVKPGNVTNYDYIKSNYLLLSAKAKQYTHSSGLKSLFIEIQYKDKMVGGNIHLLHQTILTNDFFHSPLIILEEEQEKKSLQELLLSSVASNRLIPDSEKDIQIDKTKIFVNNWGSCSFESYTNLRTKSLIFEKFMQNFSFSRNNSKRDLFTLCGNNKRYLEIMYTGNEPVYAQFSDNYKVETVEYNPNSSEDANKIVERINEEIDIIIENMYRMINNYYKVKKLKNNVD